MNVRKLFPVLAVASAVGFVLFVWSGPSAFAQDAPAAAFNFDHSEAAPEINSRFQSQEGWIGGESATSVSLGENRTLWLFGDTFVGTVKHGRRSNARVVHNSAGLQCGADAPCQFVVRKDANGKPADLVKPADGRGWMWFQAATMLQGKLYIFMSQCERSLAQNTGGHIQLAQWLGIVSNPQDDPKDWCIEQIEIPFTVLTGSRELVFGAATVVHDGYLFIYGTDLKEPKRASNRYLVAARVPVGEVANMNAWRFRQRERWSRDFDSASHLADYFATDASVDYVPASNQFLMVYTDCGVSNRLVARTAPTPAGPWSDIVMLHSCKEANADGSIYCYGGKAHAQLSTDGKVVISYLTAATDPWQITTDSRLFWPTFVKVGVSDLRSSLTIGALVNNSQIVPKGDAE